MNAPPPLPPTNAAAAKRSGVPIWAVLLIAGALAVGGITVGLGAAWVMTRARSIDRPDEVVVTRTSVTDVPSAASGPRIDPWREVSDARRKEINGADAPFLAFADELEHAHGDKAWALCSGPFQVSVSRATFADTMATTCRHLGARRSLRLVDFTVHFVGTRENATQWDFVYLGDYERRDAYITATLTKDADGTWRVHAYRYVFSGPSDTEK